MKTETEILRQIVQKQDEILKIVLPEIMVDEFRECVVPLMELYNLNQQLEKAQGKPLRHYEAQNLESKMGF